MWSQSSLWVLESRCNLEIVTSQDIKYSGFVGIFYDILPSIVSTRASERSVTSARMWFPDEASQTSLWCSDFLVVCNHETSLISDLSLISSLFVFYLPALPVINSAFLSIWKANKCANIPLNFGFCLQMSRLLCWLNHIAMIKDTIKEFIEVAVWNQTDHMNS